MTDDSESDAAAESQRLAPDDAFAVLGNDIRMDILRTLAEAEEDVSFSTLYDAVDVDDSGQFSYHLDKMVGHFVADTDDGYRLALPGRRIVEAILSGTVTDRPSLSRTPVDTACPYCGASVEIQWAGGGVELFCQSCSGRYGRAHGESGDSRSKRGYLGRHPLPPAGTRNRDPDELLHAAWTWGNLEILSVASGLCPRCSGTVEWSVDLCEDHDAEAELCDACGRRYALGVSFACGNCIFTSGGEPVVALVDTTELLALLTTHGLDPVDPESIRRIEEVQGEYEEEIVSSDPLRAAYTFTVEDDSVTITVDDDLAAVDVTTSGTHCDSQHD